MRLKGSLRASCLLAACGVAATAHAQQSFSNYIGPANGLWSVNANWDNGVPDIAGEVPMLPPGVPVTLNISVTVDKIGGSPGSRINVNNGLLLHIVAQSDGTGTTGLFSGRTIALNTIGAGTYLRLVGGVGTYAVHGPSDAVIEMNGPAAIIDATTSGATLINNGTITGSGQVGQNILNVENNGFILASRTGETLTIDPVTSLLNTGRIAAASGTLALNAGTYTQTGSGEIGVDGGVGVVIANNGAILVGGRFDSGPNATERLEARGATFRDFTIDGRVVVPNGNLMYLQDSIGSNSGVLRLESAGAGTYLRLLNDTEIDGTVAFSSTNFAANIIDAQVGGLVLTNSLTHGIEMAGQIGQNSLNIVNNTAINASGSAGLVIDPVATLVNNGTLRALSGSTLTLNPATYTNTGHVIEAQTGGLVILNGCTVIGGTLASPGPTGNINIQSAIIEGTTTSSTASVNVLNGNLGYVRAGLTNNGTLSLLSVGAGTYLRLLDNQTFNGTGVIFLSNLAANIIDAQTANLVLTNNTTIRGSGQVGANSLSIVNLGLIEAQGSIGMSIDPPAAGFTNTGTVRALTGSGVTLLNGNFANDTGLLEAQTGATGTVNAATITGGVVRSLGTGVWNFTNSSTSSGVTFQGNINSPNGNLNYFSGPIANEGVYALSSVGSGTYLRIAVPEVTITGGGVIALSNSLSNVLDAQTGGHRLVLQDQTIRGSGQLGANSLVIVNHSLIEAQGSIGITIDPPAAAMENTGIVRALAGSAVRLSSGSFNNAGGLIVVEDGAAGSASAATVTGGVVRSLGSGLWSWTNSAVLRNLTLEGAHTVPNGNLVYAEETIVNRDTLTLASVGSGTYLRASSPVVTLTGGGTLLLTNSLSNVLDAQVGGHTLIVQNQTIRGAGQIGVNSLAIINRGSIIADSTASMQFDPPAGGFLNDTTGLLHVQGSGAITMFDGPFENRGTVLIDATRKFTRSAGSYTQTAGITRIYGELEVANNNCTISGGRVEGTGLLDSNTINVGGVLSPGDDTAPGTLFIEGTYTQQPDATLEIQIGGSQGGQFDVLAVTGAASLNGLLRVRPAFGHEPTPGDTYIILTASSRNGTFGALDIPGFQVEYFSTVVRLTFIAPPCDPDFNQDGNVDQDDIDCLAQTVAGNFGCSDADADFNRDGNVDQDDIQVLAGVVAGDPCPQ